MPPDRTLTRILPAFYLFLLPLFFVLHGYVDYYDIVFLKDALLLLLEYLVAALVLSGVFYFLLRSWPKAALYSFILLCFHFFFGGLHDWAKTLAGKSFLVKYSFLLPFSMVVLILVFLFIKRANSRFGKLATYLTVVLTVLIAADIIQLVPKARWSYRQSQASLPDSFVPCDTCTKPDVYLIIADEYAGREQLQTLFNFDNTGFENELRKRGFHVVNNPRSNYNSTPFSVASLFNMEYLEGIKGDHNNKEDIKTCYEKINRSTIARFFKNQGYTIKSYSIFNFEDIPAQSRFNLFPSQAELISGQTFLSRIEKDILPTFIVKFNYLPELKRRIYSVHIKNEDNILQLMEEVTSPANQPRFVYTHLLMPHDPYYFDRHGKPYDTKNITRALTGKEREYVNYLQYSNKKFLELIDHILDRSAKPPIIIFMSDHGYRYYNSARDPKYRYMNVNFIYLPNRQYEGFYNGLSNVNQFRVLLNTVFGQKLPLLKDSTILIK